MRGDDYHKRKRGKKRNAHFMDAAMEAYIRSEALTKMRELEDCQQTNQMDMAQALASIGNFVERAPYQELWNTQWRIMLEGGESPGGKPPVFDPATVFTEIENTVKEAMMAEQEQRIEQGAPTIEDTKPYKAFIDKAMDQLLEEASGEIEEL